MSFQAVTGLFDVGRDSYDGRTIENYIDWLNATLMIPLPFIIFLDVNISTSKIKTKVDDIIIRVEVENFSMFRHRRKIEEIVEKNEVVNSNDISFNLPEYGMLVMSKPEMLKRAAKLTNLPYLIWLDAGLSRFIPDLTSAKVVRTQADLIDTNILVSTSLHYTQRKRLGKFPHCLVGSTQSMMSAGDFIIARDFAEDFANRVEFLVETDWLPLDRYDNEQVAIGCLMFRGGLPGVRILHTDYGPLAPSIRWLFGVNFLQRKTPLHVWFYLVRDEIRTRLTSRNDCYLPNDFPEENYNSWKAHRSIN